MMMTIIAKNEKEAKNQVVRYNDSMRKSMDMMEAGPNDRLFNPSEISLKESGTDGYNLYEFPEL